MRFLSFERPRLPCTTRILGTNRECFVWRRVSFYKTFFHESRLLESQSCTKHFSSWFSNSICDLLWPMIQLLIDYDFVARLRFSAIEPKAS